MTKISNESIYGNEDPISENDFIIGTDGDSIAKKTKTFKFSEIRDFVNAGLEPVLGGTLAITNYNYSGVLTTPEAVINQLFPNKTIMPYEVFVIDVNGNKYINKLQNRVVGDTQPPTVTGDYIPISSVPTGSETKVIAGTNTTVTGTGTVATPYVINSIGASDATTTLKGLVKLAGDLGGTADLPTTPTALHKTGDETKTGYLTLSYNLGGTPSGIILTNGHTVAGTYALDVRITNNGGGIKIDKPVSGNDDAFSVRDLGIERASIKNTGVITGLTFVKTGGTATQYLMANGSVSTLDGSETKITNGTNTTVVGNGTVATPYQINVATPTAGLQTATISIGTVSPHTGYHIATGIPAGKTLISVTPYLRCTASINTFLPGDIVNISPPQANDSSGLVDSGVHVKYKYGSPTSLVVSTNSDFDINANFTGVVGSSGSIGSPIRYNWNDHGTNWTIDIIIIYV